MIAMAAPTEDLNEPEGMPFYHRSVLVGEVLDSLAVLAGRCYLDGTLGGGGLAGDTIGGRAVCWTATGREADADDWGSSIDAGLGPLDLATAPAHEQM